MTNTAPELPVPRAARTFYARVGKRALDTVLAGTALLALAPVVAGVGVAVAAKHGRPVIFRQKRTGLGGKAFEIFKFRTMNDARGPDGALLPDSRRMTPLGQLLRRTSLDELPELLNVLRGEMSLVGPRPLLHHYMEHYTPRQKLRHAVRPGVTGWAAVNGRNTTSWEQRFELDSYYVEHMSLRLDLEILARTVMTVLRPTDVEPGWAESMPEYRGPAHVEN
jgi:sugar transferase EpsL